MKPAPFAYCAPSSLTAVLDTLADNADSAKLLAGGQSLIPVMNFRLAQPTLLIDLNQAPELSHIHQDSHGNLHLGAMVRQRTLEQDLLIQRAAPLLHMVMPYIAHPQIRNRGTLGGSLAHADPAGELPMVAVALQAKFRLQKQRKERWLEAEEFFIGLFSTALEPGEMLTEVVIPLMPAQTGYAFQELARRHGDYAQAGVTAVITLDAQGHCQAARLVYLNLGEVPTLAPKAAALLIGTDLNEAVLQEAIETAVQQEITPDSDIHATANYKRHLARVLTTRCLAQAIAQAKAWKPQQGAN